MSRGVTHVTTHQPVASRTYARGQSAPALDGRRAAIDVPALAELLGVEVDDLPAECRTLIGSRNFDYTILAGVERDRIVLEVLRRLEGDLPVSGEGRLSAWQEGWSDIMRRFEASGFDAKELLPHYFRRGHSVMRVAGEYVLPADPWFEANFVQLIQAWVARSFLEAAGTIYEFGCGPGHNLAAFARLLPSKRMVGLDWVPASQQILARIAEALRLEISARRFDMFRPDDQLHLEPEAAVVTIGSMEQLGTRFEPFLEFLLRAAPLVCVHLEPIHELYNGDYLLDYLASRYAEKRGYLRGYLPKLRQLEQQGLVKILHVKRHLGSLYHDGWGSIVWRPLPSRSARGTDD